MMRKVRGPSIPQAVEQPPQVVRNNDGEIQLEWHRCGIDIEITIGHDGGISGWWALAADPERSNR